MTVKDRIKTLRTEVQTLTNQGKALVAEMELKGAEKVTGEDRAKLEALIADGQIKRKDLDQLLELDAMDATANTPDGERQTKESPAERPARKSWGEQVVTSKAFKDNDGKNMRAVGVKGAPSAQKAIYNTDDAQGGYAVRPDRDPEIYDIARQRPITLLTLVNRSRTTVDAVEYVRMTSRTNNAATVAERTSGAFTAKPEGDLALDMQTATVKTVAEWIAASRQILMDAPRLADLIDNELAYQVGYKLEDYIINGTGSGSTFTGILATSGIQTRVMDGTTPVGRAQTTADTKLDTLRRALTDIRLAFYEPDGLALNPGDSEALELAKDSQGRYLMMYDPIQMRLWRAPIVETQVLAAGTALVGAWKIGATLWDRMQTEIRVSENVSDDFIRNAVRVLAELRAAFGVIRPLAFEKVTLT